VSRAAAGRDEPVAHRERDVGHLGRVVGEPGEVVGGELAGPERLLTESGDGVAPLGEGQVGEVARRLGAARGGEDELSGCRHGRSIVPRCAGVTNRRTR
jgi:hypothetical protein